MGNRCDKCKKRFKKLNGWFGFWLCVPCMLDTVDKMKKAGVIN